MRALILIALIACAGCTRDRRQPVEAPDGVVVGCDAAKAQRWVGKPLTPALVEAAQVAAGASTTRTIAPDTMVTMDYRADRLNVKLDEKGIVTAIGCG